MKQILTTLLFIFALFLTACSVSQPSTPTPESTPTPAREELPVFPGSEEIDADVYHYTISDTDALAVQRFYKKEMQNAGWELLGIGDISGTDIGEAYVLWFTKDEEIASIDIFVKEDTTHVVIRLE